MRKESMKPSGDGEHAHHVQRQTNDDGDHTHSHPNGSKTGQMHEKELNAD
jgi:hypothetical protein